MKIDKIVFSTSERFSVFWNINSRIWNSFGVKPICLLFGKKKNTDMNEDHGDIIEMPIIDKFPLLIQIMWSKFYWPISEPDTTWMIGDIDLIPLQSYFFTENIASIPENNYAHLNCDGITQLAGTRSWVGVSKDNIQPDQGHYTNLPGHYHCAKGSILKLALEQNNTFEEEIKHIVESGLYNNTRAYRESDPIEQHNLWCAEEHRSTKAIRRSIISEKINFTGVALKNGIKEHDMNNLHLGASGDTIDRTMYDNDLNDYVYDFDKLASKKYVDLHSIRPFSHVSEDARDKRWQANLRILKTAGVI
tara:strand:- start:5843 stop:6757 length:915 start_codon:yes stop_codon:yes gene_type:complete